jgi:hypothetical protein
MTERPYNYAFISYISYKERINVIRTSKLYIRNKDGVHCTKRAYFVARKIFQVGLCQEILPVNLKSKNCKHGIRSHIQIYALNYETGTGMHNFTCTATI